MEESENMTSESNCQDRSPDSHWLVERDLEKCSLCEVCTRSCPTGALQSELAEDTLQIVFRPELCDGCRICVDRCPEEAGRLVRIDSPPDGPREVVLARSRMLRCAVCGQTFAPIRRLEAASRKREDGIELMREECPLCRRTQMVATFIEEKREAHGRKAEYKTGRKWHWNPVVPGDPDGPPCPEVLNSPSHQNTPAPDQDPPDST